MRFNRKEDIEFLTKDWQGERFEDGRPKVSDQLLDRLKEVTTEEAVMALINKGYMHQFEGDLQRSNQDKEKGRLIGRAVTTVMVPTRIDVHNNLLAEGRNVEGKRGFFNQWVIETLVKRDVIVVDMCDQILFGTYVGGNLSTAIKTRTETGGAVIWGGIRDLEQIVEMDDFQVYYRGVDPTPIGDVMMSGMNTPARIGRAVCLPGDVVHGTISGITFIPAHLAEHVAATAEKSHVKDIFGFERLKQGVYTSAQIDNAWTMEMMEDFLGWYGKSEEAEKYRGYGLDWTEELGIAKNPERPKQSNGLVDYKLH